MPSFEWLGKLNRYHALAVVILTTIFLLGGTSSNIQSQISSLQSENVSRKFEIAQEQQDIRQILNRLDSADTDRATMKSDISWIRHFLEKER